MIFSIDKANPRAIGERKATDRKVLFFVLFDSRVAERKKATRFLLLL